MTTCQKCRLYFFLLEPSCTLWDQTCLFTPDDCVVWECFQSMSRMKMKEHRHGHRAFFHMAKVNLEELTDAAQVQGPPLCWIFQLWHSVHTHASQMIWNPPGSNAGRSVTRDCWLFSDSWCWYSVLLIQLYWIFSQTMEKIIPLKKRGMGPLVWHCTWLVQGNESRWNWPAWVEKLWGQIPPTP